MLLVGGVVFPELRERGGGGMESVSRDIAANTPPYRVLPPPAQEVEKYLISPAGVVVASGNATPSRNPSLQYNGIQAR